MSVPINVARKGELARNGSSEHLRERAWKLEAGISQLPNFTIVLRVSVEFRVTTPGPPL